MLETENFSFYLAAEAMPIGRVKDAPKRMDYAACDPSLAAAEMKKRGVQHGSIVPIDRASLYQTIERHCRASLLSRAVRGLAEEDPASSAAHLPVRKIFGGAMVILLCCLVGALLSPKTSFIFLNLAIGTVSLLGVLFRQGLVLWSVFGEKRRRRGFAPPAPPLKDEALPVYTILVPLFREARILPNLIRALKRIDYPRHKLDIKLLLEEEDAETIQAVRGEALDKRFHILIVPSHEVQTKPKACNYGLLFARGDLITIYDAEDIPDPRQLRKAAAHFRHLPADVVALQAHLSFFNGGATWLTRQFALEYLMHFRFFLPFASSLGLPILLGGTSNHFRIEALRAMHGWDSYNVTEDAELGLRLARHGFRAACFESETREEANGALGSWIRQRSRWIKGWMQSYASAMRQPRRGLSVSWAARFYLHLLIPVYVVNILAHGLFWPLTAFLWVLEVHVGASWMGSLLFFNLLAGVLGYGAAIGAALLASGSRGCVLWRESFSMPFYWILSAVAVFRAFWQFFRDPHYWDKTEHGLA